MKSFAPHLDRILVLREELQKSDSMIVIPDDVAKANRPSQGMVAAVGPTASYYDDETGATVTPVKEGDFVVFGKHAGTEIEYAGAKYWVVAFKDILVIERA